MTKYKTTNGVQTGFVPGVGEIVDGIIEAPENWQHGANFEKVVETPKQEQPTVALAAPAASPAPQTQGVNPNPPNQGVTPQVEQPASKETA